MNFLVEIIQSFIYLNFLTRSLKKPLKKLKNIKKNKLNMNKNNRVISKNIFNDAINSNTNNVISRNNL